MIEKELYNFNSAEMIAPRQGQKEFKEKCV